VFGLKLLTDDGGVAATTEEPFARPFLRHSNAERSGRR
jgi:hypothetical protein